MKALGNRIYSSRREPRIFIVLSFLLIIFCCHKTRIIQDGGRNVPPSATVRDQTAKKPIESKKSPSEIINEIGEKLVEDFKEKIEFLISTEMPNEKIALYYVIQNNGVHPAWKKYIIGTLFPAIRRQFESEKIFINRIENLVDPEFILQRIAFESSPDYQSSLSNIRGLFAQSTHLLLLRMNQYPSRPIVTMSAEIQDKVQAKIVASTENVDIAFEDLPPPFSDPETEKIDDLLERAIRIITENLPSEEIVLKEEVEAILNSQKNQPTLSSESISKVNYLAAWMNKFRIRDLSRIWDIDLFNDLGITWIEIPEGWFFMGGTDFGDEREIRRVYLNKYWISQNEITCAQFRRFLNEISHNNLRTDNRYCSKPNYPVVMINWDEAVLFCIWLSKETGKKVLLPTEAQWEKAARGADRRKYPWGNRPPSKELANYDSPAAEKVGSFPNGRSPFGVNDMVGNVWEWCRDYYSEDFYHIKKDYFNPQGPPGGIKKTIRGGSWFHKKAQSVYYRSGVPKTTQKNDIGFRIVLEE